MASSPTVSSPATSASSEQRPAETPKTGSGIGADPNVVVRTAEFAALDPAHPGSGLGSLDHLLGVTVTITAELGRATRPIGDVLKFGVGSVVELGRAVAEPVDLLIQGVRVGRGEVVVVDDRFAVRITEIIDSKRRYER
jgi:flagellar motor switch protein FliN